jgi:hypothetical protein
MAKRETIEEFLSRGGQITQCPPQEVPKEEDNKVNPTCSTGSLIMTLSEGSLFYSDSKAKPKQPKKKPEIDVAALPPHLLKFVPRS